MSRVRQFRFALYPTAGQEAAAHRLLDAQCEVYNAALQQRRDTYRLARLRGLCPPRVSYVSQCRELTAVLAARPELAAFGTVVSRGTLRRVDRAYSAFFRRVAAGERAGYPRFRSVRRFDSVSYEDTRNWKLDADNRRLYLQGIGCLKVRLHRAIPDGARLRTCVLRRQRVLRRAGRRLAARWSVTVAVELPEVTPLPKTGRRAGVDLGVRVLAAVADEGGRVIQVPNPAPLARARDRLAAAQRRVARAQSGSGRRAKAVRDLQGAWAKVANTRAFWAHQLSHDLVAAFDLIAIENLAVANMTRSARGSLDAPGTNVAAKAGLNRSILDATWGQLRRMLDYKAADAGRELVVVDPRGTSQTCAACGHREADNRHGARFECRRCGHGADADNNAAMNILQRAESVRQPPAA